MGSARSAVLAPRNRTPGFTLVESIVGLVVMGIVMSVAMPAVSASVRRSQIDRAGFIVSADLGSAFTLAERQMRPVRIAIQPSRLAYQLLDRQTGTVLAERFLGPVVSEFGVERLSPSALTVDVFPNGIASAALDLDLVIRDQTRRVTMSRVGQTRVYVP